MQRFLTLVELFNVKVLVVKQNLLPFLKQKLNGQNVSLNQIQISARSINLTDEKRLVGLTPLEIVEVKLYNSVDIFSYSTF